LQTYKQRDEEKQTFCKKEGITLIQIPFWWDHDKESIVATLQHYLPDIIPTSRGVLFSTNDTMT